MGSLKDLNLVIAFSVSAILAVLLALGRSKKGAYWQLNPEEYSNTTWALRLWFVWWLTLFFIYLGINRLPYSVVLVLSDFGNLCALGAAIAYCKDKNFKLAVISRLLWVFVVVFMWDLIMTIFPSVSQFYQGRIVTIAPSLLISGVSSLALGWAIVIRCGWPAWLFLLFAASYSVAQLPAYFLVFVLRAPGVSLGGQSLDKLDLSLLFLAIGKIIYAWAFLGYFFSTKHNPENFMVRGYWPDDNRRVGMHPIFVKWFGWAILLMMGSFLTALAAVLAPEFLKWVKGLLGK